MDVSVWSKKWNNIKYKVKISIEKNVSYIRKVTAVFWKQTWAELKKSNLRDAKFFSSVFLSFFFALKARLQVLKFEFCQI